MLLPMMNETDSIDAPAMAKEAICAIASETLPHASLILFGSRARGDARRRSDFDLAVLPKDGFSSEELIRFAEAVEISPKIIYPLDIVDTRTASPALIEKIQSEGQLWKN